MIPRLGNAFEPPPAKRRKAEFVPAEAFAAPPPAPPAQPERAHYVGGNRRSKLPVPESRDFDKIKQTNFRHLALELKNSICHIHVRPAQMKKSEPLPNDLPEELATALRALGYSELFSHQLEVRKMIMQNKDVIITTPTSSGKSIAFCVPVFQTLLQRPDKPSCALFLFPLNALAIDQEAKMRQLNSKLPLNKQLRIVTINGEIPPQERAALFRAGPPHVLITNPDTLHFQLKKYLSTDWKQWGEFLKRLSVVVLDEAHCYTGVMGTNVANLIRRLYTVMNRLNEGQEARLRFIISSATVGNPQEMASRLLSRPLEQHRLAWVNTSGAATFERTVVCLAAESNPKLACSRVIKLIIEKGMTGIVFVNSIPDAISMLEFMQRSEDTKHLAGCVRVYYATQPNGQKRQTIAELRAGKIRVIITTNALEAGIDIPEIEVCVVKGYPGSRMSFLQRIGRAGRSKPGFVLFIPHASSGMDFYYAEHPEVLLDTAHVEKVAFNANYPVLLKKHILCAIAELGGAISTQIATMMFGYNNAIGALNDLTAEGVLKLEVSSGVYAFSAKSIEAKIDPHATLSMRGGEPLGRTLNSQNSGDQNYAAHILAYETNSTILRLPSSSSSSTAARSSAAPFIVNGRPAASGSEQRLAPSGSRPDDKLIETLPLQQALSRLIPHSIFKTQVSENGNNVVKCFEVIDLNLQRGEALMRRVEPDYANRDRRVPIRESKVECKNQWKEKWFTFEACPEAVLHVTLAWARVIEKTTGLEVLTRELNAEGKYKSRIISYDQPYHREYEAPCVRFSFNTVGRMWLDERVKLITPELFKSQQNQNAAKAAPELEGQLAALSEWRGAFVALHTLIHQLTAVAPLMILTSSASDLQEQGLDPDTATGHIVDSVPGGNGACESLFDNFEQFISKAEDWNSCCRQCESGNRVGWGCALCLYQAGGHCVLSTRGLISCIGADLLKLRPAPNLSKSPKGILPTMSQAVERGGPVQVVELLTSFNSVSQSTGGVDEIVDDDVSHVEYDSIENSNSKDSDAKRQYLQRVQQQQHHNHQQLQQPRVLSNQPLQTRPLAQVVIPSTPPVVPSTPEHRIPAPTPPPPPTARNYSVNAVSQNRHQQLQQNQNHYNNSNNSGIVIQTSKLEQEFVYSEDYALYGENSSPW